VVVKLRQPGPYRLDIAMNPESRLQADLYRVWFHQLESEGGYYPDALIPAPATVFGKLPDPENDVPGQTAAVFWLDLWVPRGSAAKEERVRVEAQLSVGDRLDIYPLEVRILPFAVPDEDALDAGHNSYSAGWIQEDAYHRLFYEHRGVFHAAPEFAPALEGKGRRRRMASWDLYDRHYGPLLDGSAFAKTRRGPRPIRYAYLPVDPEWPAEFVHVAGEMERHFRQKGWTKTRLQMFFKGFPWDGGEARFPPDDAYFRRYRELLRRAVPADSPVPFVFRNDASWAMERQFEDLKGVVNFWVLSDSILSFYPEAPDLLKRRGDTVWFYGSAAGVTGPAWATLHNPLRAWMWGVDGYCLNGGRETLAYPGTKFGRQEPLPSLRLKIERNGLQDVALLKALEERMGPGRLREEVARLTNGRRPGDWWTTPRPALADRPPEEWTNTDIDQAARPRRRVEEGLTSDWWPEIRRWIYSQHMERLKP